MKAALSPSPKESNTTPESRAWWLACPAALRWRSCFLARSSRMALSLPTKTISSSSESTSEPAASMLAGACCRCAEGCRRRCSSRRNRRTGSSSTRTQSRTAGVRFAVSRKSRGTSPTPSPVAVPVFSCCFLRAAWSLAALSSTRRPTPRSQNCASWYGTWWTRCVGWTSQSAGRGGWTLGTPTRRSARTGCERTKENVQARWRVPRRARTVLPSPTLTAAFVAPQQCLPSLHAVAAGGRTTRKPVLMGWCCARARPGRLV